MKKNEEVGVNVLSISPDGLLLVEYICYQHFLNLSSPLTAKVLLSALLLFPSPVEEDEANGYGNVESKVEGVGTISALSQLPRSFSWKRIQQKLPAILQNLVLPLAPSNHGVRLGVHLDNTHGSHHLRSIGVGRKFLLRSGSLVLGKPMIMENKLKRTILM